MITMIMVALGVCGVVEVMRLIIGKLVLSYEKKQVKQCKCHREL